MFTNPKFAGRTSAHSYSLLNHCWAVAVVTLVLLLSIRRPIAAQTAEAAGVVVTGEAVATPTPHDNFREMRQHIMPEVAGTEITVTKKAIRARVMRGSLEVDSRALALISSRLSISETGAVIGFDGGR